MKTLINENFKKFLCEYINKAIDETCGLTEVDEDLIEQAKHAYVMDYFEDDNIVQWINYRNHYICLINGKFRIKERLRGGEYVDNLEFNTVKEAAEYLVRHR